MNYTNTISKKMGFSLVLVIVLGGFIVSGQETNPDLNSSNTYHNQLFFNRFLINPTFSLVRENKSYLNILHRNQYATFNDNSQNYFLGFSNKLNENTAVGIGVYSQWSGVIQEFGFNANYATAVKIGDNSKLTFGANVTYFNQGLDKNRVVVSREDPEVLDARKESKIAIQPGINLSLGKFDFGLYAEDLLRYNQTTNEFLTSLTTKSVKASLQYTHTFEAFSGLFKDARLMPLAQLGRNLDGSLYYLGSLLLDLPKYGWLQTTIDQEYGISAGVGFNLSQKMSLGYLMEKDLSQNSTNLGWNHELSLAYTFKDDDSIGYADSSHDSKIDRIVRNYEEQIANLISERDKERKKRKNSSTNNTIPDSATECASSMAYQNKLVLDELIIRQDSIEDARTDAFEQRFETVVRLLRTDIKNSIRANIDKFSLEENTVLASNDTTSRKNDRFNDFDAKTFGKQPIRIIGASEVVGVKPGYYVIANVYKNKKYLNAFIESLEKKGLKARKFYNKENGLYYVYLADYDYKKDAQTAFVSDLQGKYRDEKWIMQVNNSTATASNTYEDEASYNRDE